MIVVWVGSQEIRDIGRAHLNAKHRVDPGDGSVQAGWQPQWKEKNHFQLKYA